ncbi:hypothetical protein B0H11DRAFT_2192245 [Mycena galericulata]|nr:hypothetical protein B0H11DRAFT_2192245 [Mycena galericulata]
MCVSIEDKCGLPTVGAQGAPLGTSNGEAAQRKRWEPTFCPNKSIEFQWHSAVDPFRSSEVFRNNTRADRERNAWISSAEFQITTRGGGSTETVSSLKAVEHVSYRTVRHWGAVRGEPEQLRAQKKFEDHDALQRWYICGEEPPHAQKLLISGSAQFEEEWTSPERCNHNSSRRSWCSCQRAVKKSAQWLSTMRAQTMPHPDSGRIYDIGRMATAIHKPVSASGKEGGTSWMNIPNVISAGNVKTGHYLRSSWHLSRTIQKTATYARILASDFQRPNRKLIAPVFLEVLVVAGEGKCRNSHVSCTGRDLGRPVAFLNDTRLRDQNQVVNTSGYHWFAALKQLNRWRHKRRSVKETTIVKLPPRADSNAVWLHQILGE